MFKLIYDQYNGQRLQWKYYQHGCGLVRNWFDFGPAFETREEALAWGKSRIPQIDFAPAEAGELIRV